MDLVDCYNCFGVTRWECGFPVRGCLLCYTYGDGLGHLKKEYRYKSVEIPHGNHIDKFTPPNPNNFSRQYTKH